LIKLGKAKDDSNVLQESNLTAQQPRRAPITSHYIIKII